MPHSHCATKREVDGQIANGTLKLRGNEAGGPRSGTLSDSSGKLALDERCRTYKERERTDGERSQGACGNVDVTH